MKTKLIFFLLFISSLAICQDNFITEYYTKYWEPTTSKKFYYKREIQKKSDTLYVVKDFVKNKYLEMEGQFSKINPLIENGVIKIYDKAGKMKFKYTYEQGDLRLIETQDKKINYDFDIVFESDLNKSVSNDSVINASKSILSDDSVVLPTFQGGDINKFRSTIFMSLHFPYLAMKYQKVGTVLVNFTINKNGNVEDVSINESIYNVLDKEAMRLIKNSPKWNPGLVNGEPYKVRFTDFPIVFVLY